MYKFLRVSYSIRVLIGDRGGMIIDKHGNTSIWCKPKRDFSRAYVRGIIASAL